MRRYKSILGKSFSEFIGTFALVFFGCGSLMIIERFPGAIPIASVPLIFGGTIAAMIYALGHISGAHFNPAVSLGFVVARHLPLKDLAWYWVAQFLGAIVATAALCFLLPEGVSYGASVSSVSPLLTICWEAILTFFLMFVIISVATDTRAVGVMAGAAIGLTVSLGAVLGGSITGGSMNPARSLGPALFQSELSSIHLYFIGPVIGAVLAALTYEMIRRMSPAK